MSNAAQYPPADHEHVPDCDDYAFSGAGFHPSCERSCICRQVARVEHRVIGEAVQRVEKLAVNPYYCEDQWHGAETHLVTSAVITAVKGDQP